jgi:acyl-CoA reductase-like NAD-dependent aldehyde dehydrogenase
VAQAFAALRVGDPLDPETELGPLGAARALARVRGILDRAIGQGATVVTGGGAPAGLDEGFFFAPTLLKDVTEDMDVVQNEVFGPIIVILPYTDVEDAIRMSNSTKYGLAASVYSRDQARALEIAQRLISGSVGVNLAGVCLTEPFGGVKQSGWGREGGAEGLYEFTSIKQILLG